MESKPALKVLVFGASLREYSLNRQLATLAARIAGQGGATVNLAAMRDFDVPAFDGDEALSVFESPRQAIRTAVALQERFVEHTLDNPALPLRVGIGIGPRTSAPVRLAVLTISRVEASRIR